MLHIVWEFHARPERRAEFEAHYGPQGSWAQLFRNSPEYRETTLAHDQKDPSRFLVVDIWESSAGFEAFKTKFKQRYDELDRRCEELTLVENCIGYFDKL
jgi:heme-degrading monooxygenase HmoA